MRDHKVDVIVLSWNNKSITKNFVDSFLANTSVATRLIIIDNASTDGTQEYLLGLKDTADCVFKIVLNHVNKGFVGGMNQGISLTDAPFVCLANNDLLFTPGWLEEIISVFEGNPDIGLLNPNSNNLGARRADGQSLELFGLALREEYRGVFVEMPFCVGFCMFIRREVLNIVGGLSPEFAPFFFEDTDYSLKTLRAGYLAGLAKGAYVWHQEHASFKLIKKEAEEVFVKNREIFKKKWGNILRILWIADNRSDVAAVLKGAIELARNGNYVWFMTGSCIIKRDKLFKDAGFCDHSGIKFLVAKNCLSKVWNIVIKKKRYDVVISNNALIRRVLSVLGYNVLDRYDSIRIENIKKA